MRPDAGRGPSGTGSLAGCSICALHTAARRAIFLNERPGRGVYS
jgi:hypothetical protein